MKQLTLQVKLLVCFSLMTLYEVSAAFFLVGNDKVEFDPFRF